MDIGGFLRGVTRIGAVNALRCTAFAYMCTDRDIHISGFRETRSKTSAVVPLACITLSQKGDARGEHARSFLSQGVVLSLVPFAHTTPRDPAELSVSSRQSRRMSSSSISRKLKGNKLFEKKKISFHSYSLPSSGRRIFAYLSSFFYSCA